MLVCLCRQHTLLIKAIKHATRSQVSQKYHKYVTLSSKRRKMSKQSWNVHGPENLCFWKLLNIKIKKGVYRYGSNFDGPITSSPSIWSPLVKKWNTFINGSTPIPRHWVFSRPTRSFPGHRGHQTRHPHAFPATLEYIRKANAPGMQRHNKQCQV